MADGGTVGTEISPTTTVGFTSTELFEAKIKKLAADNNLSLGEADSTVAARRLQEADDTIRTILLDRGLTLVQISTWKRGAEFQLDIATFWYAKDCGWGAKNFEEKDWTTVFNRTEELKTAAIIDDDGVLLLSGKAVAVGMDLQDINATKGWHP